MDFLDGFLKQIATGDKIKDYKHASKLFVGNNYARSPKYGWLYHVFFDLNPLLSRISKDSNIEAGMLVKAVDLPKFDIDTKVCNSYNRPNIVQSKVKYNSLRVIFHDDSSNVVRNLWFDYYKYYYRDTDGSYSDSSGTVNPIYYTEHKYSPYQRDQLNKFGYSPRQESFTTQYINAIRIYSLHQKRFSEYTLINPTIVSFSHGNHASDTANTMEHNMLLQFETVLYASGFTTPSTVKGFADLHYDKSPSPLTPLGGGTNSIMGPGGILNAADSIIKAGASGNWGQAILTGARSIYNNRNVNLKTLATNELTTAVKDILSLKDPRDRYFVPTVGSLASNPSVPLNSPLVSGAAAAGSIVSNGTSLNAGSMLQTARSAINAAGNPGTAIAGINTSSTGAAAGGAVNKVLNITYNSPLTVVGIINPADEFTYNKALEKLAADKAAEVTAENTKTIVNPLLTRPAVTAPVFNTGTNTSVDSPSPLQQTPYANKIIPAQPNVVNNDADKFITTGNPAELVEGIRGKYIGAISTPPAKS